MELAKQGSKTFPRGKAPEELVVFKTLGFPPSAGGIAPVSRRQLPGKPKRLLKLLFLGLVTAAEAGMLSPNLHVTLQPGKL